MQVRIARRNGIIESILSAFSGLEENIEIPDLIICPSIGASATKPNPEITAIKMLTLSSNFFCVKSLS